MARNFLIVTVLLVLVLAVDGIYGNFCDQGLPGRYCFKDLSGWYECTIDSKTQKMIQKTHKCPASTRCQCFYGVDCPSTLGNPCAKYELPPPFPEVFSTFYTTIVTDCDAKSCKNFTNIGEFLQNSSAGEQRHDRVGAGSWETTFIFPFQYIENNNYIQFDATWFDRNCTLNSKSNFPRFGVPPYFTCGNTFTAKLGATFKVCEWRSGGHSKTDEVIIEKWLLIQLTDGRFIPFAHEVQRRPTPASNNTEFYDTVFASFFPDYLDPSQLSMPKFCGRNLAALTTSRVEGNEPGNKPLEFMREKLARNKAYDIAEYYDAKRRLQLLRNQA